MKNLPGAPLTKRELIKAAQELGARGYPVFAVNMDGSKRPIFKKRKSDAPNWQQELKPNAIERHFERAIRIVNKDTPKGAPLVMPGIGIATGHVSGLLVLDIDTKEGHDKLAQDGQVILDALIEEHGDLPATLMAESPSGSRHMFFQFPTPPEGKRLTIGSIERGLDFRGDGGYVLCAPTYNPLRNGSYRWLNNLKPAKPPAWLVRQCMAEDHSSNRIPANHPMAKGLEFLMGGVDMDRLHRALMAIPNADGGLFEDFNEWSKIAMALYQGTQGSAEGLELLDEWSKQHHTYDEKGVVKKWEQLKRSPPTSVTVGKIFALANEHAPGWNIRSVDHTPHTGSAGKAKIKSMGAGKPKRATGRGDDNDDGDGSIVGEHNFNDFVAHLPDHTYYHKPTRQFFAKASVDIMLPPKVARDASGNVILKKNKPKMQNASEWLDRNEAVTQMIWHPGKDEFIAGQNYLDGEYVQHRASRIYNLYRPPNLTKGNPKDIKPWLDLLTINYGDDVEHILNWMAYKVQNPGEKINHALFLGGEQGIGKETILEPLRYAVGAHNCVEISPDVLFESFNDYAKSVILRISEIHDTGESNRFKINERLKTLIAAPPYTHRVNEKFHPAMAVPNVNGVVITSNHLETGVFVSDGDRRYFIAWSDKHKEDFAKDYFNNIYDWYYGQNGLANVAAFLLARDISKFDSKRPPPITAAFNAIVDANRPAETNDIADVLAELNYPPIIQMDEIYERLPETVRKYLLEMPQRRRLQFRLKENNYVPVKNPSDQRGRWKVKNEQVALYASQAVHPSKRLHEAQKYVTFMNSKKKT